MANKYVTPTGAGSQNGSDWNNALASIPGGSLVRGDTYYIAGGSYGAVTFTTAQSGTTYIYFRKATASDHGTDTGWVSSYGTDQAVFTNNGPVWDLRTGYLDFDGVTGEGEESNYGFKLFTNSTTLSTLMNYSGYSCPALRVKHCEILGLAGAGEDAAESYTRVVNLSETSTPQDIGYPSTIFQYCSIHNGGAALISCGISVNMIIDHCYFSTLGSGTEAQHATMLAIASGYNFTVRYCYFRRCFNSCTTYIEPQLQGDGFYVYGNVFDGSDVDEYSSQGIFAITSADIITNCYIYNNTVVNQKSANPGVWGGNVDGSSVYAKNNLWYSGSSNYTFQRATHDYNWFSGGSNIGETNGIAAGSANPFIDLSGADYHIVSNISSTMPRDKGVALASTFSLDPDGNTRGLDGSWDIGAYEYSNGTGSVSVISLSSTTGNVSNTTPIFAVTASRSNGTSGSVSVNYTTFDGSAIQNVNYTAVSGTLNWTNGESSDKTFNIPILNTVFYGSVFFTASIFSPTGSTLGSQTSEIITIYGSVPPVFLTSSLIISQTINGQPIVIRSTGNKRVIVNR